MCRLYMKLENKKLHVDLDKQKYVLVSYYHIFMQCKQISSTLTVNMMIGFFQHLLNIDDRQSKRIHIFQNSV